MRKFVARSGLKVDLTFRCSHKLSAIPEAVHEDLKSLLSEQDVTLSASDGQVKANLILLKMRSPVFRAMFGQETWKEFQTMTVDMTDFPKDVLEAFVEFLLNEKLVNPDQTASDLLKLGDKYDIPSLVTASKNYLLDNATEENVEQIYDLFKSFPRLIKESFVKAYGKRKRSSP